MDCLSPLCLSRLPHEPLGRFRIMLHAATRKLLNKLPRGPQSAALFIKHFYSLAVAQCIYLAALDLKLTRGPTLSFVTAHSHAEEDEMNRNDAYENRPSKSKGDALGRGLESLMGDQESWQAHQAADARPNRTACEQHSDGAADTQSALSASAFSTVEDALLRDRTDENQDAFASQGFSQTAGSVSVQSATRAAASPGELAESVRSALESAQVPYAQNIEETLQNPELPAGCEAASLAAVLKSMGYDTSPIDIVKNCLTIDPTATSERAFAGNPYIEYGGAAFPPAIVDAANAFLEERDAEERAQDVSGEAFSDMIELIERGYPVIVWSTVDMVDPAFTGAYLGRYAWYSQEHCVVLYGTQDDSVLVCDPLEGLVTRDAQEFERIWEACGSMAVLIS